MGPTNKRNHSETAGGEGGGTTDARKFKRPRTLNRKGVLKKQDHDEPKVDSTRVLRNRIRDLKRLLSHIDNDADNKMPANIRIERERELETCEHELAEKQQQQRETDFRNKIIGRYHHIRFFERQKATRAVKRIQKQHAALADDDHAEKAKLRQTLHNAEVDLNYTIYCPLLKNYVSLYPRTDKKPTPATKATPATVFPDGPKGDIEMWKAVENAMENNALEALRNSREGVTIPGPKHPVPEANKTKKDHLREKKEKQKEEKQDGSAVSPTNGGGDNEEEDDEDSDGGFFE
ncbi:unnamed protein product [Periconia digitata]|uniref:rRNA-processing protein EFG1 n=1 Tax=Periconia digitata TaxID=1303443 RepID=A0A9W4UBS3_9PLEO|nr:unnamed protein product [Periconia digitata]